MSGKGGARFIATSGAAYTASGAVAATVDAVFVGGGTRVQTVDGEPVEITHDLRSIFHVRFISPDRSVGDQLREADTFEAAAEMATAYARKVDAAADQVAALAESLRVD